MALVLLYWAVFARAILSWFRLNSRGMLPIKRVIEDLTEPILSPLRRLVPQSGVFDISPLLAMLIIELVRGALHRFVF